MDRSGAYYARWVAKELVKKTGGEALVQFAWSIGKSLPIWSSHPEYNKSVQEIIKFLNLKDANFYDRTKQGHFGGDR